MRSPSENKKMRGLRAPDEGWALIRLIVACIFSGRASACRKQGKVTGAGSALMRSMTLAIVCGDVGAPSGATQRSGAPPVP